MTTYPIIIHMKLRCPLSMDLGEYLSERGNQEKGKKLKSKMYHPGVITGNLGRDELC